MNINYIKPHEWKIIEEWFNKEHITASESIFSLGNGAMWQRANFEEFYSGTPCKEVILEGFITRIKQE